MYVIVQPNRGKGGKHFQQLRRGVEDQGQVVDLQMPLLHPANQHSSQFPYFTTYVLFLEFWETPIELEKDVTSQILETITR